MLEKRVLDGENTLEEYEKLNDIVSSLSTSKDR